MSKDLSAEVCGQLVAELLDARLKHMHWVQEALGSQDPLVDADPRKCLFGQWIQKSKEVLGHLPEFQALEQPHLMLHESFCRLYDAPDEERLEQEVRTRSGQLIEAIDTLEKRLSMG